MGEKRVKKTTGGLRVAEETDLAAWAQRHRDRLTPEQRERVKGEVERLTDLGLEYRESTRLLRRLRTAERRERKDRKEPEIRRLGAELKPELSVRQREIRNLAEETGRSIREAAHALTPPRRPGPPPITLPGGTRPPVEQALVQQRTAQAAREWHARWRAWRAKLPEEIVRAFPAERYDEVMYWASRPLKRAHTRQGIHRHGTGTLSIMLRPDGSRVYALPEGTVAHGLGTRPPP